MQEKLKLEHVLSVGPKNKKFLFCVLLFRKISNFRTYPSLNVTVLKFIIGHYFCTHAYKIRSKILIWILAFSLWRTVSCFMSWVQTNTTKRITNPNKQFNPTKFIFRNAIAHRPRGPSTIHCSFVQSLEK